MGKEVYKNLIEEIKETLENYNSIINPSATMIEACPFIVQVGIFTVGTDDENKTCLENKNYPTQFSQKGVNEILKIGFKHKDGTPVKPEVFGRLDWYKKEYKRLSDVLSNLEKAVEKI